MSLSAAPQVRWNDRKFHFDPSKPRWIQVAKILAQVFAVLGGIVLVLAAMFLYPMLLTGPGFALAYLGPAPAACAAAFLIRRTWLPADMQRSTRVQLRFCIGFAATFWLAGLFGLVNGYTTPVVARDAGMVYKRTSTPSDPKHMSYYVGARVWPSSRDVYEITVPADLYRSLDVPTVTHWSVPRQQLYAMPDHGVLRLIVGRGRLGVDWLHGVVGVPGANAR